MHYNRYSKMLRLLLKFSPKYGEVFLRNMGINQEWFAGEAKAILLGVRSQQSLKIHAITRIVKKTVQPGFEERVAYFREAAMKQAIESVENGFSALEHLDPSGKQSMESARELRKEMLKNNSKRKLRQEYNSNIDQEHFALKTEDV
jgi:hypothetical protein